MSDEQAHTVLTLLKTILAEQREANKMLRNMNKRLRRMEDRLDHLNRWLGLEHSDASASSSSASHHDPSDAVSHPLFKGIDGMWHSLN